MSFTLYFMGYEEATDIPDDEKARAKWVFSRPATLELTQYVNRGYTNYESTVVRMIFFVILKAIGELRLRKASLITMATPTREDSVRHQ